LQWLTEPSAERRLNSATAALETLESGQIQLHQVNTETPRKPVSTWLLFTQALFRSTFVGGGIVAICAGLYGSIAIPFMGTIMGGMIGAAIGFPLGMGNGLLIGLITRLFFYPLQNAILHQRVLSLTSTIICTAIGVICFGLFGLGTLGYPGMLSQSLQNFLFFAIAPPIITGLSMAAVSKSFAQWYEKESRSRKYLK
jgi:eukaryotic-like serine/threonine-protein kinase